MQRMRRIVAQNGVVYYRSELIPCLHGFSSRIGGVSEQTHTASLNLAFGRGDSRETVLENLFRFGEAVGFDVDRVISVNQIHSVKIRTVSAPDAGEGYLRETQEACDGYLTFDSGIVLGVKTADCVPILLYAPQGENQPACVAALHAGWRGSVGRIAGIAVEKMKAAGIDAGTVRGAIGPAIGACCYEVREDFRERFAETLGTVAAEKYVRQADRPGVWYADIKALNRDILLESGLTPEHIDLSGLCTSCHPVEFFSHRYSGGHRGTMLSVISLNPTEIHV